MSDSPFVIRALHRKDEIIAFDHLAHRAFASSQTAEQIAAETEAYKAACPTLDQEEVWAAFDPEDGRMLGGYLIQYRRFHIDSVTLKTGCIGAVAVAEEERNRGVAATLMRHAVDHAVCGDVPLLLLNGIPDFYYRFGYVPVLEATEVTFKRSHIRELPPQDGIFLRKAVAADAETLLNLRRLSRRPVGHFDRSLAEQVFHITRPNNDSFYLLAFHERGDARGYLLITQSETRFRQQEVVALDWPALAALLQEYERLLDVHETPEAKQQPDNDAVGETLKALEIDWHVPPGTPLFYELIERIPFSSRRLHHYNADWMARPGNLEKLMDALSPLWTERIMAAKWHNTGVLNLTIDGQCFSLRICKDGVRLGTSDGDPALGSVTLTLQAFTQLCFGFRPAAWFATRPKQTIPQDILPLMDILWPRREGWIARSDYF